MEDATLTEVANVPHATSEKKWVMKMGEVEVTHMKLLVLNFGKPPSPGDPVYIRYVDHVLFKRDSPDDHRPCVLELRGWLDFQDETQYRIVWEKTSIHGSGGKLEKRASGVSIAKTNVLEIRRD